MSPSLSPCPGLRNVPRQPRCGRQGREANPGTERPRCGGDAGGGGVTVNERMSHALARLEAAFVREGSLRRLVLEGEREEVPVHASPSEPWMEDLRRWESWRPRRARGANWHLSVEVPTRDGAITADLVCVDDNRTPEDARYAYRNARARSEMVELAHSLGLPSLQPILQGFFVDTRDGSVWRQTSADGRATIEREAHGPRGASSRSTTIVPICA